MRRRKEPEELEAIDVFPEEEEEVDLQVDVSDLPEIKTVTGKPRKLFEKRTDLKQAVSAEELMNNMQYLYEQNDPDYLKGLKIPIDLAIQFNAMVEEGTSRLEAYITVALALKERELRNAVSRKAISIAKAEQELLQYMIWLTPAMTKFEGVKNTIKKGGLPYMRYLTAQIESEPEDSTGEIGRAHV